MELAAKTARMVLALGLIGFLLWKVDLAALQSTPPRCRSLRCWRCWG